MNRNKQCCGGSCFIEEHTEQFQELDAYLDSLNIQPGDMNGNRRLLIQCLHKAQGIFGFLPLDVQLHVGKRLRLQQSDVYGVISFYSFFTDKPVGDYCINVCTGTACFVKGADRILEEFQRVLKIDQGETTPDLKYSLGGLRCVGGCSLAPVVMVNERVYGNVTPKMVPQILKDCQ